MGGEGGDKSSPGPWSPKKKENNKIRKLLGRGLRTGATQAMPEKVLLDTLGSS